MPLPGQKAFEFDGGEKPFDESEEWKSEPVEVLHIGQCLLNKLNRSEILTLGQLAIWAGQYSEIRAFSRDDAAKVEAAVAQYHRFVEMDRREGV